MESLSIAQANQALGFISPDLPRDDWWRILAAVKSEFGDAAYSSALDWSQSGDTFRQSSFDSTWRSLSGDGVGIGTLIYHAKQGGWSCNLKDRQAPPPKVTKRTPPPPTPKTADYAKKLWANVQRDDALVAAHPYAVKKGIDWACGAGRGKASGSLIGQGADCLIIPMRTMEDAFTGVECINADGVKQTFGNKGCLVLGNPLDELLPVYVVEGWADAASLWRTMGNIIVVAAFGLSMLDSTATKAKVSMPTHHVTVVEDGV